MWQGFHISLSTPRSDKSIYSHKFLRLLYVAFFHAYFSLNPFTGEVVVEDANRLFGIKGWLDQFFVSLSIHLSQYLVTGPPSLIDYYQNIYRKKWSRFECPPNNVSSYFFRQRNRSPYHLPLAAESFLSLLHVVSHQ